MNALVDLSSATLVTVDLQAGNLRRPRSELATAAMANSVRHAEAFAPASRPVIAVCLDSDHPSAAPVHAGADVVVPARNVRPGDAALPEELAAIVSHHVSKLRWSAFDNSTLSPVLAGLCVDTIVPCGLATGPAAESTARSALKRGLRVVVATDAVADTPERHENSLAFVLPMLAALCTTDTAVAPLQPTTASVAA